jgi:hypothetical protein
MTTVHYMLVASAADREKLEELQDLTGAQGRLRNKLWTGIKAGR